MGRKWVHPMSYGLAPPRPVKSALCRARHFALSEQQVAPPRPVTRAERPGARSPPLSANAPAPPSPNHICNPMRHRTMGAVLARKLHAKSRNTLAPPLPHHIRNPRGVADVVGERGGAGVVRDFADFANFGAQHWEPTDHRCSLAPSAAASSLRGERGSLKPVGATCARRARPGREFGPRLWRLLGGRRPPRRGTLGIDRSPLFPGPQRRRKFPAG